MSFKNRDYYASVFVYVCFGNEKLVKYFEFHVLLPPFMYTCTFLYKNVFRQELNQSSFCDQIVLCKLVASGATAFWVLAKIL